MAWVDEVLADAAALPDGTEWEWLKHVLWRFFEWALLEPEDDVAN